MDMSKFIITMAGSVFIVDGAMFTFSEFTSLGITLLLLGLVCFYIRGFLS